MAYLIQTNIGVMLFREVTAIFKKRNVRFLFQNKAESWKSKTAKIPRFFSHFFLNKITKINFQNNDVLFIILLISARHKNACSMSEYVLKLKISFQKEKHIFVLLKNLNDMFM